LVTRVRLMEKPDCGLCDEALRALRGLARQQVLDIERVDITADPSLFDRYALRIPVIVVGGRELDVAGVDAAAIRRWLSETELTGH
jgi:hypothetical protein